MPTNKSSKSKDTYVKELTRETLNHEKFTLVFGVEGLFKQLEDVKNYVQEVRNGKLSIDEEIINGLRELFDILTPQDKDTLVSALHLTVNDNESLYIKNTEFLLSAITALGSMSFNNSANKDCETEKKDEEVAENI